MKWFRMYSEVLHDPKVQKLSPALFKAWVNLLCLANDTEPRGTLPSVSDIAFALRVSETAARNTLRQLCEAGLFDDDNGTVTAHGWNTRQKKSDNVTERVTKYREETAVTETLQKRTREEERRNREETDEREEAEAEPPQQQPPQSIVEIRDLVLSKLSPRFQRDPAVWDEAEQFAADFEGRYSDVAHAIAEFRRNEQGPPFPQKLRKYMPGVEPENSWEAEKARWLSSVPP